MSIFDDAGLPIAGGPIKSSKSRGGRPKKCNCKNSKCLKLYCDCFSVGVMCDGCNCNDCKNTEEFKQEVEDARKAVLKRNPKAFTAKFVDTDAGVAATEGITEKDKTKHARGCNCAKSRCVKNYCECWQMGIECTDKCKCVNCANGKENDKQDGALMPPAAQVLPKLPPMPPMLHGHDLGSHISGDEMADFQRLLGHERHADELPYSPFSPEVALAAHRGPHSGAFSSTLSAPLPPQMMSGSMAPPAPGSSRATAPPADEAIRRLSLPAPSSATGATFGGAHGGTPTGGAFSDSPFGGASLQDLLDAKPNLDEVVAAGLVPRMPPLDAVAPPAKPGALLGPAATAAPPSKLAPAGASAHATATTATTTHDV